jgi:hypothetical protein
MNATTTADAKLKTRHRAIWASGDYPSMVETFLLLLGPRLVEACGIAAGDRVLDIAAGTVARVCRPGGTIGLLSWTPEGFVGALLRTVKPFAPAPPPGAQPPPLWGSEDHLAGLFGERVRFDSHGRGTLVVTAFERSADFAEHFRGRYGPTIAARANAEREGRAQELDAALDGFFAEWDRGTPGQARFEMEYLLSVGSR